MSTKIRNTAWMLGVGVAAGVSVASAQTLNLYTARHYDSDEALYEAFERQTGVEVNVLEGDSDQLIERIRREGAASPADIFMTVDAARLQRAEAAGLFAPVDSEVLTERIPAPLRDPENLWFGFSERVRIVYYDKEQYDEPPLSRYEELADPRFEGEVCIRSSNNDYNQSLVASLIAANGPEATEDWAEGLVDNMARPPQGGDTDQIRGVAAGECGLAVGNHYYWIRLALSDDKADQAVAERAGLIFPNQDGRGTHRNIGGAGMVEGAPNPEAARQFLEFLASDEAQKLFSAGNNEFPAVEGVEPVAALQPYTDVAFDDVSMSVLGDYNADAVRLMDRAGWR
ncbi:Fe(3+) ABC transporter substrate-binding protein [Spiribacter roseus]|uniref:Fe(3+) ABC transporter substrate-binding protein n=1 Tax=Spiribacter roseus TaxID=1855875 RepID=UPI00133089F4|nr:Fe(3+) ABC transporter substrate-binding protein [Spiribacter roseus]KAF0284210.1 Fe(3+) ABC transporter substrate-binding protein [Spiribacter roseus]